MPTPPAAPQGANEPRDLEQGTPPGARAGSPNLNADDPVMMGRRPRSSLPSFFFLSFVLFMLTNNQSEELAARNQYLDALSVLDYQLSNFTAWRNGTESNFTLPAPDPTVPPLLSQFLTFTPRVDPLYASYYANLTGYWKGDVAFHNLTHPQEPVVPVLDTPHETPPWHAAATQYLASANETLANATEFAHRLGPWNWTLSKRVDISFGDKIVIPKGNDTEFAKDIAMIHGKIDFSYPDASDELRLELDGVHFVSNGSIYALAKPSGHGIDLRNVLSIIPSAFVNSTARIVEEEMSTRIARLKEKIELGVIEDVPGEEGPSSNCDFVFYGQISHSNVPLLQLQEVESEIDNPTGITTVHPPKMLLKGVLMSKDCGMLYELPEVTGMKSNTLYRKITTYAGISTLLYVTMILLFFRQMSESSSVTGLARVSRYPFIVQSLIDAMAFVGHVTLAIIAEGRTSISVLAPAALACVLFVQEAQFAVLIGQMQASEDVRPTPTPAHPPTSPPTPAPVTPPPPPTPLAATTAEAVTQSATPTVTESASPPPTNPTPTPTPAPPATVVTPPPQQQSVASILWEHFRNDPSARLWAFMCFFLLVILRLVLALSLPFLFVASLYSSMWFMQIYRAVRRARTSGLRADYLFGTTVCRLFYFLYYMGCPNNILDVEPRKWTYAIALFVVLQMLVIMFQERFGPAFFLPTGVGSVQTYDYHPALPLPDPEAPEQSLGDCAICMDAIVVDPSLRQQTRFDEKGEAGMGVGKGAEIARRTGALFVQSAARKSYSLAPCHHLFHTACLERWLAIKNICPQCRRPLPPL